MRYIYETHCHTSESSMCASLPAAETVQSYIDAGYTGMVITNHFSDITYTDKNICEKINIFLRGYKLAKEYAKDKIDVFLGMELRFDSSPNDYLIYGIDEEFVRRYNTEEFNLQHTDIETVSKIVHDNGLLIFQAHPFRNNMQIVEPSLLDGVEVYNGTRHHRSRNEIAEAWAKRYGLLEISGSDAHNKGDGGRGGILTYKRITDNKMLLEVLRSRPVLIKDENEFEAL